MEICVGTKFKCKPGMEFIDTTPNKVYMVSEIWDDDTVRWRDDVSENSCLAYVFLRRVDFIEENAK